MPQQKPQYLPIAEANFERWKATRVFSIPTQAE